MKQKLLALAIAGALAPGLAFAQAANVQIYGAIDLRVDSMKFGSSSHTTAATVDNEVTKQHVHCTACRWGFRGSENLGGGMTAFFQVESGMTLDGRQGVYNGVNLLGGRDSYLGLGSTQWGAIQLGGFATPYSGVAQVWSVVPTFGHAQTIMGNDDTTGALPSPIAATTELQRNGTSFATRQSNQIQYTTPAFAGIVFRVATAAPESKANNDVGQLNPGHKSQLGSYSLTWSGGPFSVAGAYEQHRGYRAVAALPAVGLNQSAKDTGWTLGGRWNYGMGLLGVGFERLKYANTQAAGAENDFRIDNWVVNGTYNVGPSGTVSAGYSRTAGAKECGAGAAADINATTAVGSTANMGAAACGGAGKANIFSLTYDHRLSKRTALYAAYGRIDNGSGTNYYYIAGPTTNLGTGQTGANVADGVDVRTYAVGVKHTF